MNISFGLSLVVHLSIAVIFFFKRKLSNKIENLNIKKVLI
jgi:hypothetical protein